MDRKGGWVDHNQAPGHQLDAAVKQFDHSGATAAVLAAAALPLALAVLNGLSTMPAVQQSIRDCGTGGIEAIGGVPWQNSANSHQQSVSEQPARLQQV